MKEEFVVGDCVFFCLENDRSYKIYRDTIKSISYEYLHGSFTNIVYHYNNTPGYSYNAFKTLKDIKKYLKGLIKYNIKNLDFKIEKIKESKKYFQTILKEINNIKEWQEKE